MTDASVDAVSLGTIHGAKGLEFPAVFLPALHNGCLPANRALEELRVVRLDPYSCVNIVVCGVWCVVCGVWC